MAVQPGGQQPDGQQPNGRKLSGGAIASLTGLGVLLIFIIQNTDRVRFQFLFWTFTWPLWLVHDHDGALRGAGVVGLPRFDGQGWWLGQATCVRPSFWALVSNSLGVW
jgi:hypothetical protein